ncbi:hypothetical protein [Anaeroselena agilis]|uniref:Uncharacterized protein n=1 Tax=Anaeroselena agilis TaxID=3063788 RepID=A0ABU3P4Z7_9FIRM|nr:hypothetical protein [Selenomonadales bacterium 4137-cl]
MKKKAVVGILVVCLLSLAALPAAQAIGLGDIIKAGGIGFLVDKFSGSLNNFINRLMAKNGADTDYATKVVPILSLGSGGYIGAAQIVGDPELVEMTQAVLQVEANFDRQFRIKALIPIDSKNPANFSRVQGVGVAAVIDIRI